MGAGSVKSSDRERLRQSPGRPPEQAQPRAAARRPGRLPPPLPVKKRLLGPCRDRSTQPGFGRRCPRAGNETPSALRCGGTPELSLCRVAGPTRLAFLGEGVYQEEMLGDGINWITPDAAGQRRKPPDARVGCPESRVGRPLSDSTLPGLQEKNILLWIRSFTPQKIF